VIKQEIKNLTWLTKPLNVLAQKTRAIIGRQKKLTTEKNYLIGLEKLMC